MFKILDNIFHNTVGFICVLLCYFGIYEISPFEIDFKQNPIILNRQEFEFYDI